MWNYFSVYISPPSTIFKVHKLLLIRVSFFESSIYSHFIGFEGSMKLYKNFMLLSACHKKIDIFMMIMLKVIFLHETWYQSYSFLNCNKFITGEYLLSSLFSFPLKKSLGNRRAAKICISPFFKWCILLILTRITLLRQMQIIPWVIKTEHTAKKPNIRAENIFQL